MGKRKYGRKNEQVYKYEDFDRRAELIKEGMRSTRICYIGDNKVLLMNQDEIFVEKIIINNREKLEENDSIFPWTKTEFPGNKIVWVKCRGLLISLWNEKVS